MPQGETFGSHLEETFVYQSLPFTVEVVNILCELSAVISSKEQKNLK